jgi:hypothetical protein
MLALAFVTICLVIVFAEELLTFAFAALIAALILFASRGKTL